MPDPFLRAPHWLPDRADALACRVFLLIAQDADYDTGACSSTQERLATKAGRSVRSIRRAIRSLDSIGALSTWQAFRGHQRFNVYMVWPHVDRRPPGAYTLLVRRWDTGDLLEGDTGVLSEGTQVSYLQEDTDGPSTEKGALTPLSQPTPSAAWGPPGGEGVEPQPHPACDECGADFGGHARECSLW